MNDGDEVQFYATHIQNGQVRMNLLAQGRLWAFAKKNNRKTKLPWPLQERHVSDPPTLTTASLLHASHATIGCVMSRVWMLRFLSYEDIYRESEYV